MRLIDVAAEGMEIERILMESEGELTPELESRMDALLAVGADALDNAAWVVRKLTADAALCASEAERFQQRKASFENAAAILKGRMLFAVDTTFNGKAKTAKNTIWGQTSAATTSFDIAPDADLAKLAETNPGIVRTTLSLDKQVLKMKHDSGQALPAEINVQDKPGTRYLRIK